MWRTDIESADVVGARCTVEREGLRWRWTVRTGHGLTALEASGYSTAQDAARVEAERVARGLASLVA